MNQEIQLYQRPHPEIVAEIIEITKTLTGKWFTANVPEDTGRDLLFQDALCLKMEEKIVSFIIFTCWDGEIHITLMGTHPDYHRLGIGSVLMKQFVSHIKALGFDRVAALTVPPDVKPVYAATVKFYEKHGFVSC